MKPKNPFEILADIDDKIEALMWKHQRLLDHIETKCLPKWENGDIYYDYDDDDNYQKITYKLGLKRNGNRKRSLKQEKQNGNIRQTSQPKTYRESLDERNFLCTFSNGKFQNCQKEVT
jgi:hypothetical protein